MLQNQAQGLLQGYAGMTASAPDALVSAVAALNAAIWRARQAGWTVVMSIDPTSPPATEAMAHLEVRASLQREV
jgi:hypothetical protein